MGWILLLLAFACFVVTWLTTALWLGVLCLLVALGLMIASAMHFVSQRVSSSARDVRVLSPEELRALRDEAQSAAKAPSATPPSPVSPPAPAPAAPLSPEARADALLAAARRRSTSGAR